MQKRLDIYIKVMKKGPESIKDIFGLRFSENLKFLFYVFYIHIIKAICHSYKDYAQISVSLFTVAMDTPTGKVKIHFS